MDWQAANRFFRLLPTVLSAGAFKDGIAMIAGNIDDYRCDLPLAPQYIAQMFAGPIADGHLSFADLAEICKRAGPPKEKDDDDEPDEIEEGYILEEGIALDVVCKALKSVADIAGAPAPPSCSRNPESISPTLPTTSPWPPIRSSPPSASRRFSPVIPLTPVKGKIAELLGAEEGFEASAVATEMEGAFDAGIRSSAEYVQEVALAALRAAIPDASKCDPDRPMEELERFIPLLKSVVWGPDKDDKEGTGDGDALRRAEGRARRRPPRRAAHEAVQGHVQRRRRVRAADTPVEGQLQRHRPGEGQGAVRGAGVPRGARARGG